MSERMSKKDEPPELRQVAGRRTSRTPSAPKNRQVRITGPSGTLRDGRIVFQSGEPLIATWTMQVAVPVADLLRALDRVRVHLEESMAREDAAYIDAEFSLGVETRIEPGQNPHLIGHVQLAALDRRPRREGGK